MKKVAVLGSTGSIGRQTLEVIKAHPDEFELTALAFGSNTAAAEAQAARFKPRLVGVSAAEAKLELPDGARVFRGVDAAVRVAKEADADIIVNGISGFAGTLPLVAALDSGRTVALANKESIVCAFPVIKDALKRDGSVIPVDSEQSALFQCLMNGAKSEVKSLVLTASGGPFFGRTRAELFDVTAETALRHPIWSMGRGISLDSATMFNKGLEVMEAARLFGFAGDSIRVLIHPQAVVHSMVEYVDGQVIAQLAVPDMRGAIQYALSYPRRISASIPSLDLAGTAPLEFFEPDDVSFPALKLAYSALSEGETLPIAYTAAKEEASAAFLRGELRFTAICDCVEAVMDTIRCGRIAAAEDVLEADREARALADSFLQKEKVAF